MKEHDGGSKFKEYIVTGTWNKGDPGGCRKKQGNRPTSKSNQKFFNSANLGIQPSGMHFWISNSETVR